MKGLITGKSDGLIATRYSLLSRLKDRNDQESWKVFFDTYWHLIYLMAVRSGLTETEAEDVVQETVICVARDIENFKRDRTLGTFKGWLRKIVRWRIVDQFRQRNEAREKKQTKTDKFKSINLTDIPDPAASLETLWEEEWTANLFQAAVDRVKHQVREEHFQIFYLYVTKEWPVQKIARAMRVSAGQVYLVKHRVAALVKKELRRLEKTPL